jgi:hypothetical protein
MILDAVPHRAGDDDDGLRGEVGQVGRRCVGAEQDQRLAASPAGSHARRSSRPEDGAEREFVVGVVGGGVEPADEVAEKGCTANTTPISRLRALRSRRARLSGR